jgi:choline monooxygenase
MLINFRNAFPTGLPMPAFAGANDLCTQGIYSFHLFPNLSVVFGGPNLCFFIAVWPLAADRCLYNVHYLTPAKRSDANTAFLDQLIALNRTVLNEDLDNLPFIQRSIATGGIRELRLQYMERRIYYLHEEIDRRIGANVPPALKVVPLLAAHVEG